MSSAVNAPLAASIVVAVYNRAHQIVACLESLVAQDCDDFEILVVDDGSTDASAAVVEEFIARHPQRRIELIRCPTNRGATAARNVGVDRARGRYVAFVDSDIAAAPDWLRSMLAGMERQGLDAASGRVEEPPPRTLAELAYRGQTRSGHRKWESRLVGCNMAVRTDLARRYRFDETIRFRGEEIDLERRMASDGCRIGYVAEAAVLHNHPLNARQLMRVAFVGGKGSAWYAWKHRVLVKDVLPMAAALAALPFAWAHWGVAAFALACLLLQAALIVFLEGVLQRKGAATVLKTLPLWLAFYVFRTLGFLWMYFRAAVGLERQGGGIASWKPTPRTKRTAGS